MYFGVGDLHLLEEREAVSVLVGRDRRLDHAEDRVIGLEIGRVPERDGREWPQAPDGPGVERLAAERLEERRKVAEVRGLVLVEPAEDRVVRERRNQHVLGLPPLVLGHALHLVFVHRALLGRWTELPSRRLPGVPSYPP